MGRPYGQEFLANADSRSYEPLRPTRSRSSRGCASWNRARQHSDANHATLMALAESRIASRTWRSKSSVLGRTGVGRRGTTPAEIESFAPKPLQPMHSVTECNR
jgi:hypothetical protein